MYWIGLIIMAIAAGHHYDYVAFLMVLGGGIMFYGFMMGLYNTINVYIDKLSKR